MVHTRSVPARVFAFRKNPDGTFDIINTISSEKNHLFRHNYWSLRPIIPPKPFISTFYNPGLHPGLKINRLFKALSYYRHDISVEIDASTRSVSARVFAFRKNRDGTFAHGINHKGAKDTAIQSSFAKSYGGREAG
jgi:hypothetical protein